MQESWLSKKADEIQSFADRKDMKKFFDALKTVHCPQRAGTTHSLVQMELVFWLTKSLSWKYDVVLMLSLVGHHLSIMKLSTDYHKLNVIRCFMSSQPSLKQKAIKLLSLGKAPGSDAIPADVCNAGGPPVAEKLTELFHIMWRKEAIPQEFKDATNIRLFKRKENPQVCDVVRAISLLSVAWKILARVLLNRLNERLTHSGLVSESQCGFRKDKGTNDMVYTARELQEKCQENNVDIYMTFVDLTNDLTQSVVREFGKLCQSLAFLSNS